MDIKIEVDLDVKTSELMAMRASTSKTSELMAVHASTSKAPELTAEQTSTSKILVYFGLFRTISDYFGKQHDQKRLPARDI